MDGELNIGDYISIVKRRYWYFIIPFVVILALAIPVIVLLPPVYESQGVILIESPQISREIVSGSIDGKARERIEVIKQRVMTRNNLLSIAEKYQVFKTDKPGAMLTSDIVNSMRDHTVVEFISSGTSRRNQTTIAFKVIFQHRRPLVAARVANELVTLFVSENVSSRIKIANETTQFLNQEAEKLERQLKQVENQIANYKQENADSLPENLELRMAQQERLENSIREIDREIKSLQEERRFLDIQLRMAEHNASQNAPVEEIAEEPALNLDPSHAPELQDYIKAKGFLDAARVTYSEAHPDVRALVRQLEAERTRLENEGGTAGTWLKLALAHEALQAKDITDEKRDSVKAEIGDLEASLSNLATAPKSPVQRQQDNTFLSASINLENIQTQIAVARDRITSLRDQQEEMRQRLAETEEAIIRSPQIDRGLRDLERDYLNAQKKYAEIRDKAMEAQIAENVEEANKSERFVLVEPPTVPENPSKPNRAMFLGAAFAVSLAVGAAALIGIEFIDGSIRRPDTLAAMTQVMPLAVIPFITTVEEIQKQKRRMMTSLGIGIILVIGGLAAIHFLYMPFDILLFKVLQRF